MKKIKWRKVLLFIVLTQIFSYMPINNVVYAVGDIKGQAIETYVNDVYKGSNNTVNGTINDINTADNVTFYTVDSAVNYLRDEMVNRKQQITFTINEQYYENISKDIFDMAVSYNDNLNSSEGDYLFKHFSRYSCSLSYIKGSAQTTLIYNIEYLTNYEQEIKVNAEVKNVLDKLNVYDGNEYCKIKKVHDYIVNNVKYDKGYSKYSAYNAIIDKSVVCQGFATLTYKMLKDLGVGVRIVTGKSKEGERHAWNIVCINGKWYYLDNTWDENLSSDEYVSYRYFLKNQDEFSDHINNSEYCTNVFKEEYPLSDSSYKINENSVEVEDINEDGIIDAFDLADVARMYNVDYLNQRWNRKYDFNSDNIIDIYDIVLISEMIKG